MSSAPIIVLGAARSGTKFVRDTLGAAAAVAVVPYDVNYIWRTGNEAYAHDALPPEACTPDVARRIRAGLYRAAAASENDGLCLIEKTVSNTLRPEFVRRVFPDARLVHLVRDGREVVESSIRQWEAPTDWRYLLQKARTFPLRNYRYALWYLGNRLRRVGRGSATQARGVWGVRYPGIEQDVGRLSVPLICARQWTASVASVERAAEGSLAGQIIRVRYEELVRSEQVITGLARTLGLQDIDAVARRYRATVSQARAKAWDAGLSAADRSAVMAELAPWLVRLGYDA